MAKEGAGPLVALRRAVAADGPVLAALHALCFPDEPWPAAALATLLEGPGVFGLIAGVEAAYGFILCRCAADEAEVLTLAVPPEHRRHGLGGQLLTAGLVTAAAYGAATMFLEVAEDNPPALALYAAAGFTVTGRRPGYYHRAAGRVAALVLARGLLG